jgi:hypothetical protein
MVFSLTDLITRPLTLSDLRTTCEAQAPYPWDPFSMSSNDEIDPRWYGEYMPTGTFIGVCNLLVLVRSLPSNVSYHRILRFLTSTRLIN